MSRLPCASSPATIFSSVSRIIFSDDGARAAVLSTPSGCGRCFPPRPLNQFAPAIRTNSPHIGCAHGAEGAFVGTNVRFSIRREGAAAFLAPRFHFKRHSVARFTGERSSGIRAFIQEYLCAPVGSLTLLVCERSEGWATPAHPPVGVASLDPARRRASRRARQGCL